MENIDEYDCIVLDLDGTLIYSSEKKRRNSIKILYETSYKEQADIWVSKRPGFDKFLQQCFENYDVGVWSMGQPGYVNAIIELFPQEPKFVYNWCHCDRSNGHIFKDLDKIPYQGKIVMVDDSPEILEQCERVQSIIVPQWHPKNKSDNVLINFFT